MSATSKLALGLLLSLFAALRIAHAAVPGVAISNCDIQISKAPANYVLDAVPRVYLLPSSQAMIDVGYGVNNGNGTYVRRLNFVLELKNGTLDGTVNSLVYPSDVQAPGELTAGDSSAKFAADSIQGTITCSAPQTWDYAFVPDAAVSAVQNTGIFAVEQPLTISSFESLSYDVKRDSFGDYLSNYLADSVCVQGSMDAAFAALKSAPASVWEKLMPINSPGGYSEGDDVATLKRAQDGSITWTRTSATYVRCDKWETVQDDDDGSYQQCVAPVFTYTPAAVTRTIRACK